MLLNKLEQNQGHYGFVNISLENFYMYHNGSELCTPALVLNGTEINPLSPQIVNIYTKIQLFFSSGKQH